MAFELSEGTYVSFYEFRRIGDLPSTDITAPENVLFVCKLNSVTTDEDLEIIFSRFGSIKR
jgi:RNA recognition motif-containing protein